MSWDPGNPPAGWRFDVDAGAWQQETSPGRWELMDPGPEAYGLDKPPEPRPEQEPPPVQQPPDERPSLTERLRGKLLTADAVLQLPAPSYLIDDVLVRDTIAVLFGKPGSGKSFLALDFGLCVAGGLPWQGREVRGGPVLHVAAEGVAGLGKRVAAWQETSRLERLDGIWFVPGAVTLLQADRVAALVEVAAELKPALVVLDTLARSMVGGDENSARDVGVAIDATDRLRVATGATVLLVHHTTKDGSAFRGSSALEGAADTMLECSDDDGWMKLVCEKQKDDAEFPPIRLRREVVTLANGMSSCVLRAARPLEGPAAEDRFQAAVLEALWKDFGSTGASGPVLREALQMSEATCSRTMNALLKQGLVTNVGTTARPIWKAVGGGDAP
jgi:hypothetical protein